METTEHDLTCKINELISLIKDKYPELYPMLEELKENFSPEPDVNMNPLQEYYDSLKQMLNKYILEHGKSDIQQ